MTKRKRVSDLRRAAILESAEALFYREGFQKATIAQITTSAGVALGTIYGYFSSKSEVLRFLIATRQRELSAALEEAMARGGEDHAVHELVRTLVAWFAKRPGLLRLVRETEFLEPELRTGFYTDLTQQLQEHLRRAMKRGAIGQADAEMLAWCVAGMVELLVVHPVWRGDGNSLSSEKIDHATGIILRSIGIAYAEGPGSIGPSGS
jgi:AcrR family transcriptional regulator